MCAETLLLHAAGINIYIHICTHTHTHTHTGDVDRSGGHCRGFALKWFVGNFETFGGDAASHGPECDNCHTSKVIMTTRGATEGWICVGYKKEGRGKARGRGCTALPLCGTFSPPPFLSSRALYDPLFSPRPQVAISFDPPHSSPPFFVRRILATFFI